MSYKFVDADQLDADLAIVGDAIREKGETSEKLSFPAGMAAAIAAISTGVEVMRAEGSFTTSSSGSASVDCGFKPDMVFVFGDTVSSYVTASNSQAINFVEETRSNATTALYSESGVTLTVWTQDSSGFSVDMTDYTFSWSDSTSAASYDYVAIKYTE